MRAHIANNGYIRVSDFLHPGLSSFFGWQKSLKKITIGGETARDERCSARIRPWDNSYGMPVLMRSTNSQETRVRDTRHSCITDDRNFLPAAKQVHDVLNFLMFIVLMKRKGEFVN